MAERLTFVAGRNRNAARRVLTAPGGPLEASPRLRRFLVIYEDGRALATPAAVNDPELQTLRRRAALSHIALQEPEEATLDEIAAANANVVDVAEFATQARQAFVSVLARAARMRASDVLITRSDDSADIRFRVDGLIRRERSIDPERATAMSNAAFNLCDAGDSLASTTRAVRAAITVRRNLPSSVLGVRLQYAPTANGFALILRLSYENTAIRCADLEEAGFHAVEAEAMRAALQSSSGVFLVAGPTEHGKSTTLNLAIAEFAESYAQPPNIVAVEDPPETQHIPYVQTFTVNTSVESEETAFENALMAALRMAPDGIKIGELRDLVSARTAYRAAGSGALVFSTIHAPFATDIPFRLMDLGLERHRAFERLNVAWVAQRLVPTACSACALPANAPRTPTQRALLADALRHGVSLDGACFAGGGCGACGGAGYSGRVLASEVVIPDIAILEAGLGPKATRRSIRQEWLQRGGRPITQEAFRHVLAGRTPLEAFVRSVASFEMLVFDQSCQRPRS